MTRPAPTPASAGTTDLREARKAVRDCIGETIPLRRRWVDAIMARVVEPLFAERIATESRLATLAAENEALRKVVKPFAKLADNNRIMTNFGRDITTTPDGWLACGLEIPVDCLRAARAALAETDGGGDA